MATCCGGNNFGVNAKVREADHALKLRRVEDIRRGGSLCVKRNEGNVPIRSKGHEEFGSWFAVRLLCGERYHASKAGMR